MPMLHRYRVFVALVIALLPATVLADACFVTTEGVDDDTRNGRSEKSAWASLAYACDRVPEGQHAIHIAPGEYTAVRTARPKSGLTIVARKPRGKDVTRIVASKEWKLDSSPHEASSADYLVAFEKVKAIKIHSLSPASDPCHRINGAIRSFRSESIVLQDMVIEEFR